MSDDRLYRIWKAMRSRCNNPNVHGYKYYGGRGISVCKEWNDFSSFSKWALSNGYENDLSIDRVDNDDDYNPSNCRWVDNFTQQNNKSNRVTQFVNGVELTMLQISVRYEINLHTILTRYQKGVRGNDLITPVRKALTINIMGEDLKLEQISERYGIPWSTLRDRYRKGVRDERIITRKFERDGASNG